MKKIKLLLLCLIVLFINIESTPLRLSKLEPVIDEKPDEIKEVLNIIYIIGDGMGFSNIKATEIYTGNSLELMNTPNMYSITTYSNDNEVTDSAAAGTALATGVKTNNETIGLDKDGNKVTNILEVARSKNMKIGIVTNDLVIGATSAAFSAHVINRDLNKAIAKDQLKFKPNVLYGGYDKAYTTEEIKKSNYKYITKKSELNKLSNKDEYVLGLFNFKDFKYITNNNDTPKLVEMVDSALKHLDNDNGFLLVIEEAHIDQSAHDNDFKLMVKHQLQMDEIVKYFKKYVEDNPNTLVIITADHETGGIIITDDLTKDKLSDKSFTTKDHVGNDVPLTAFGKNSELFFKNMDNTDIYKILKNIILESNN